MKKTFKVETIISEAGLPEITNVCFEMVFNDYIKIEQLAEFCQEIIEAKTFDLDATGHGKKSELISDGITVGSSNHSEPNEPVSCVVVGSYSFLTKDDDSQQ